MIKVLARFFTAVVFLSFLIAEQGEASDAHSRVFPNRGVAVSQRTSQSQFSCLRAKGYKDYIVISAFENNAPNPSFFENYYNAVAAGYEVIDLSFSICPTMQNTTLYLNKIMQNFFYNIPIYTNQTINDSNRMKFDMYLRKNIVVKFDSPQKGCMQWRGQNYNFNCNFFTDIINMLQLTYLQDFGVQTNFYEWTHLFGDSQSCNSAEQQYPINYYPLIWTGDQEGNPNFNTTLYSEFAGQIMPQLKLYEHRHECGGNFEFISF
ncbi:hypothetical protein ABPG74_007661 [Tetrahymena malaccensis]